MPGGTQRQADSFSRYYSRMQMMKRVLSLVILAFTVPAFATDMTIVSKVTRNDAAPQTAMSYISEDHIRMPQGESRETIVDLKSGQMTTLDHRKKTYYITTRADMDAFAARMREQMNSPEMKKAQEQMKGMSAEDRRRVDSAMSAFAFDVHKEGTSRKIAGYSCDNWIVKMGQFSKSVECVTSELKLPERMWTTYKDFLDTMRSAMGAMGPMARNAANMQEQFKKMKGFPLATTTTVDIMGHKSVTASEVTEVRQGSIPSSAWEIPSGYTKIDNPMMSAMARSRK